MRIELGSLSGARFGGLVRLRHRCLLWSVLSMLLAVNAGCGVAERAPTDPDGYARATERAHGHPAWARHQALRTGIEIDYGGQRVLEGNLLMETHGGRARLETVDGAVQVFDGQEACVSPASSERGDARFNLLTWPYFIAAPMKLRDPGAVLTLLGPMRLDGRRCDAAWLSFEPGTGDTPDDWYLIYTDPDTRLLHALAYIVTYGTTVAEASREPHAVVFHDYQAVDGVVLSTRWQFWNYSRQNGLLGDPLGEVRLTKPKFVTPGPGTFDKPEDARLDPLPPAR